MHLRKLQPFLVQSLLFNLKLTFCLFQLIYLQLDFLLRFILLSQSFDYCCLLLDSNIESALTSSHLVLYYRLTDINVILYPANL